MPEPSKRKCEQFCLIRFNFFQGFLFHKEMFKKIAPEDEGPELINIVASEEKHVPCSSLEQIFIGEILMMGDPLPFVVYLFIKGEVLCIAPFSQGIFLPSPKTETEVPSREGKLRAVRVRDWLKGKASA